MNRIAIVIAALLTFVLAWAADEYRPARASDVVAPVARFGIEPAYCVADYVCLDAGRYSGVSLTEDDREMLARLIWHEARGESEEGQQAVAEVVLNRMIAYDYPDNLDGIIYQRGQFACAGVLERAVPDKAQYDAITAALNGPNILPPDVVFFAREPENANIWGTIGNHTFCYAYKWSEQT